MPWNIWNVSLEKWEHRTSFGSKDAANLFRVEICEGHREGGPFEARRVRDVMEQYGTRLMQLKPSMIWRCAMDDLERRRHNAGIGCPAGQGRTGEYQQYAFHRDHVAKAESANDILRAAIAQPGKGQASGKRDTRLLYSDVELLKAALQ